MRAAYHSKGGKVAPFFETQGQIFMARKATTAESEIFPYTPGMSVPPPVVGASGAVVVSEHAFF